MGVVLVAVVVMLHGGIASAAVGDITTFADPAGNVAGPEDITLGPDGAYWFTNFANGRIGRITTGGAIATFTDATTGPAPTPPVHVPAAPTFTG